MSELFKEKIIEFDHESGMHIQILPKKGFRRKFAALTIGFGAIESIPDGIAHFLEHKMFEKPDGDIFNKYAALGAQCNAFTGESRTCYHFDCTENFKQNLKLLFEQVFTPYFTHENVEKEKGIIVQEINMYLDNPYYVNFAELLKLLYKNNPVKEDIAGTEESVMSITPEMLYKCHHDFYRPDNMCLTVVGDVDVDTVMQIVDGADLPKSSKDSAEKTIIEEPREIAGSRSVCKMDTSVPLFMFGFKDEPIKYTGIERMKRIIAGGIAAELLFGHTSELYEDLYESGDIYSLWASYDLESDFGHFIISGESDRIETVEQKVKSYIAKIAENGIDKYVFESLKKALCGMHVRVFDKPSTLMRIFGQFYLQDMDVFDYYDTCGKITEEDVKDVINNLLGTEMAVSIVEPKGGN